MMTSACIPIVFLEVCFYSLRGRVRGREFDGERNFDVGSVLAIVSEGGLRMQRSKESDSEIPLACLDLEVLLSSSTLKIPPST